MIETKQESKGKYQWCKMILVGIFWVVVYIGVRLVLFILRG